MARDGSGTYTLPVGNPVVTGTTISSTTHNTTMSDVASALTQSLSKDGQTAPTADLQMAGFKFTTVGDATARSQYSSAGQIQDGGLTRLGSVSGTNTITASSSPAITAYASGQRFSFIAAGANTGAVTLNINGLGAKSITKNGAVALAAGNIASAAIVVVEYDGTQFQLISSSLFGGDVGSFGSSITATSTDAGATAEPLLVLDRNSATPAANDFIGCINFNGRDSGANSTTFSQVKSQIIDTTNGSEDGRAIVSTIVAGTLADRWYFGNGLYDSTASGGDQGAGTINIGGALTVGGAANITGATATGALTVTGAIAGSSTLAVGSSITTTSTDAGAAAGPSVIMDRNSASPAALDVIGTLSFRGRDSGAASETYAEIKGEIVDPTAASEDGRIRIGTAVAGTFSDRWFIGDGIYASAATGGDKGAGTINISGDIYKNNTAYTNPDYVFERYYHNEIKIFSENEGAKDYPGLMPLDELSVYTEDHLHLPRVPGACGLFSRADVILEKSEEAILYLIELHQRLKALESSQSDGVLDVTKFGASPSAEDNSAAFQSAFYEHMETGKPIYVPPGTYHCWQTIQYLTSSNDTFTPGLRMFGDGMLRSNLINHSAGDLIQVTTGNPLKFQLGGWIKGLSLSGDSVGSGGISLRRAFHYSISDLRIKGMGKDGIRLVALDGDSDACNNLRLEQVRIEDCGNWGIRLENGNAVNETSFITMANTFIQNCGTLNGVGGGMYWRGQALEMSNTAFVLNKNRGLYIEGGAGLGNTVHGVNTVFENNVGKAIECWGVQGLNLTRTQIYANDASYSGTNKGHLVYLNGSQSAIRNFSMNGTLIRATAANTPLVAFFGSGPNLDVASVKITDVTWDNYDHPGQNKFSGLSLT